jgi:hypothetical protein
LLPLPLPLAGALVEALATTDLALPSGRAFSDEEEKEDELVPASVSSRVGTGGLRLAADLMALQEQQEQQQQQEEEEEEEQEQEQEEKARPESVGPRPKQQAQQVQTAAPPQEEGQGCAPAGRDTAALCSPAGRLVTARRVSVRVLLIWVHSNYVLLSCVNAECNPYRACRPTQHRPSQHRR